jgi:hypothetical protein
MICAGAVPALPGAAAADGAFPSSQAVLLPRDRPREIILGATFGLIFTEDDGASWRYACETDMTRQGRNYVIGAPPDDRIYGISDQGAPVSADGACSWMLSGGALVEPGAEALAFDVFPDRANPARVFALAVPTAPVDPIGSVYRSLDAGAGYEGPMFSPPAQATSTGVESSLSTPDVVYVTWYERAGFRPHLSTSRDGGDTWTSSDLGAALPAVTPYLMAVDAMDAAKLYLRLVTPPGQSAPFETIAVSSDAGATWTMTLMLPGGTLTGFVRLADGKLLATGKDAAGKSHLYRSDDGGRNFTATPMTFAALGLAERDGVLYVPTDFAAQGVALVSSSDLGQTWQPRLRFGEIDGIKPCVQTSCLGDCDYLVNLTLFSANTCRPSDVDGGTGTGGSGGCGCVVGTTPGGSGLGWVVLAFLLCRSTNTRAGAARSNSRRWCCGTTSPNARSVAARIWRS